LNARRKRTPQRNAAVTIVIIMEVAERSLVTNEKTRLTVTCSLLDLGSASAIRRTRARTSERFTTAT